MNRGRLGILVALTLLLAGCGGNGTPQAGSSSPPATSSPFLPPPASDHGTVDLSGRGAATDFTLSLKDRSFEPTFIKVAPGQTIRLAIENNGNLPHTFTISPTVTERLSAGDKASILVTIPQTGDVAFFCRFHQHVGMWGVFFVGLSPAATPTPF